MPDRAVPSLLAKPVHEIPVGTLAQLRRAAASCHACPLWKPATQTVFGAGPERAAAMLIGEQPGDQEDQQGLPFVGPAGRVLDQALEAARLDRADLYVTNTMKHFKYEQRGKVRLHKRANAAEQAACRMWLAAELARLAPGFVVAMGAMAAQTLFGNAFSVTRERGHWRTLGEGVQAMATWHPSAILRAPDEDRKRLFGEFAADLRALAARLRR
ncbi:MAG: UdgX family uracil-DNA binding protein [Gammaproteobacteria bacterium]|nr:UdgX family uracil-DNA binding protein [Gammaproteobacteria bacterium]MBV9696970.1 UdgX family uracil-DNA binding protein [Gammaproteobacteria bacterium]